MNNLFLFLVLYIIQTAYFTEYSLAGNDKLSNFLDSAESLGKIKGSDKIAENLFVQKDNDMDKLSRALMDNDKDTNLLDSNIFKDTMSKEEVPIVDNKEHINPFKRHKMEFLNNDFIIKVKNNHNRRSRVMHSFNMNKKFDNKDNNLNIISNLDESPKNNIFENKPIDIINELQNNNIPRHPRFIEIHVKSIEGKSKTDNNLADENFQSKNIFDKIMDLHNRIISSIKNVFNKQDFEKTEYKLEEKPNKNEILDSKEEVPQKIFNWCTSYKCVSSSMVVMKVIFLFSLASLILSTIYLFKISTQALFRKREYDILLSQEKV